MEWITNINSLLALVGTLVAIIAWFVKLEFNTNDNHRRIKELEQNINNTFNENRIMRESIVKLETMMIAIQDSINKIECSLNDINKKLYEEQKSRK